MYLHLGGGTTIRLADLIAILDLRIMSAHASKEYLATVKNRQQMVDVSADAPKSIVVTDQSVYLSPISPGTLRRRSVLSGDLANLSAQGGSVSEHGKSIHS